MVYLVFVKMRKECGRISCIKHVELDEMLGRASESGPFSHCHHTMRIDSIVLSVLFLSFVSFSEMKPDERNDEIKNFFCTSFFCAMSFDLRVQMWWYIWGVFQCVLNGKEKEVAVLESQSPSLMCSYLR